MACEGFCSLEKMWFGELEMASVYKKWMENYLFRSTLVRPLDHPVFPN
jgi:hypothetical protein